MLILKNTAIAGSRSCQRSVAKRCGLSSLHLPSNIHFVAAAATTTHVGGSEMQRNQHLQLQQIRSHWQAVLTRRFDRETNSYKYDDWDKVILGAKEPLKEVTDGGSYLARTILLQERDEQTTEHIKRTTRKRRTAERKVYNRTSKQIDDLLKFIKFKQDHAEDFLRSSKK